MRSPSVYGSKKTLAEKNQQLVEAERLKGEFFANVSHELRTPLTLILAPLESLLDEEYGPVAAEQRQRLQVMHGNAVRLLQMVGGLLDFSKLEAGKGHVDRVPTDVAAVTAETLNDFESLFKQKDLSCEFAPPLAPAVVSMDRYLYERVLFNLLSNAVKFTPAGGKILVRLAAAEGRLALSVADTGIGIPAAEVPRLFRKFHQVEGSSTRRFEGSGLGLALVKEIAELLGGTVTVQSVLGQGSVFTLECDAEAVAGPPVACLGSPRPKLDRLLNGRCRRRPRTTANPTTPKRYPRSWSPRTTRSSRPTSARC